MIYFLGKVCFKGVIQKVNWIQYFELYNIYYVYFLLYFIFMLVLGGMLGELGFDNNEYFGEVGQFKIFLERLSELVKLVY